MAVRPAWTIKNGVVICEEFEFKWNGGFAVSQKQKNIANLHEEIMRKTGEKVLEVSSKGLVHLGNEMSAFFLKYNGILLENVFQSSKKYENGGPYRDLLEVSPKEAKRDERHKNSGKLISFCLDGEEWGLEPKTLFYDYIYVKALVESKGKNLDLSEYIWFTDIEFNPNKSINCQARSAAIYKLIQSKDEFAVLNNQQSWAEFHKKYMKG